MITGILINAYDAPSLRGVAAHWPVTQDGFRRSAFAIGIGMCSGCCVVERRKVVFASGSAESGYANPVLQLKYWHYTPLWNLDLMQR
jgi:hypothetical protein